MQLEILTDDQQSASICKDYWRQDEAGKFVLKVQEVATRHGIKAHIISQHVEQHAFVWMATICCARCKEPYRFGTRGQYQERNRYKGALCWGCTKTEHQNIADQKKNIILKLRQRIEDNKSDLTALDLKSIIYLLAAIQSLGNESLSTIGPLNDYPAYTLSPDPAFDQHVIRYLIDKHLLLISLDTSLEAIELVGNGTASINLTMSKLDFALCQQQMTELIKGSLDAEVLQNIKHSSEFIELCKEVQLHECIGFLKTTLEEHQLSFSPGEKTLQAISACLEIYSVAQVYNFIWRAARDAAAYYMRSSISKRQAANSVVRFISRSLEQSLANDWNVKPFSRNYNLPQSSLSRIIFNTLLDTDDGGFKSQLYDLLDSKNPPC